MYVTKTNVLTDADISVTSGANTDYDIDSVLSEDFSDEYYSNANNNENLVIQLDISDPDYIAFSGSNYADAGVTQILIQYSDTIGSGYTTEETYTVGDQSATIYHRVQNLGESFRIVFDRTGNKLISLSYVAAGEDLEIPHNGEQAGYKYPWSMPQLKQRTEVNKGMPTASYVETMTTETTLTVKNATTSYIRDDWFTFLKHAISNGFFAVEDPALGEYGYYCFNVVADMSAAHNQTRELKNAGSVKFNTWTGRN